MSAINVATIAGVIATVIAAVIALRKERRESRGETPEETRKRHEAARKRRRVFLQRNRLYLALASVFVLVAGGAIVMAATTDPEYPTPQEDTLLSFIPPSYRSMCERRTGPEDVIVASLVCTPRRSGVSRVSYELYSAIKPLQSRLTAAANELGLPPGRCSTEHRAHSIITTSELRTGVILCYFERGKAVREWSNESLRVYARAIATNGDDDALRKFWQLAGPSNYNGRKAFPDPREVQLRHYVAAEFSSTCKREENLPRGTLAAIRCKPLRGADGAVYVHFSDVKSLKDYYDDRVRGLRLGKGVCDGKDAVPEQAYSVPGDANRGRRLCYVGAADGKSWIEWTDYRRKTYSYAYRGDRRLSTLYKWWVSDE